MREAKQRGGQGRAGGSGSPCLPPKGCPLARRVSARGCEVLASLGCGCRQTDRQTDGQAQDVFTSLEMPTAAPASSLLLSTASSLSRTVLFKPLSTPALSPFLYLTIKVSCYFPCVPTALIHPPVPAGPAARDCAST